MFITIHMDPSEKTKRNLFGPEEENLANPFAHRCYCLLLPPFPSISTCESANEGPQLIIYAFKP